MGLSSVRRGGTYRLLGWFYPFALAFLAIPIGLLVLFSLGNPEPHSDKRLKDYLGDVFERLKHREARGLLDVSLLTFVILFGPQLTFLPILLDAFFGAPSSLRGEILIGASLTTVSPPPSSALSPTASQRGRRSRSASSSTPPAWFSWRSFRTCGCFSSPPSCLVSARGSTSPTCLRPPQRPRPLGERRRLYGQVARTQPMAG